MNTCFIKCKTFGKALIRKKTFSTDSVSETKLNRCLNTFDLTFLGIGSTLGLGVYVLAGQIASTLSGPAVILSFFIAALASVFSGLCYAEFGARVPRAGSAYVYSYVSVGEFMAFIIGWNLILEYVIGSASVARGYSNYIDYIFKNTMEKHLTKWFPINFPYMSKFPDFLSLGITVAVSFMLAFGVSESAKLNNIFTILNLLIVVFSIICGSFRAKLKYWELTVVPEGRGKGGFMPYGISKMMSGAAMAFYGFVGFDCIATTGEEVRNPQRAIPISIICSLFIVFLAYSGVSAIQTLMWPYYDQDQSAPLPYVFQMVGWESARWIITIGALFALSTSLLGAMFPLPRVMYAMANDGVIFRFLAKIHPKFRTPLISTVIAGVFAGLMAMFFDIKQLTEMMSIGTLLAYSLVALSVLILRYNHGVETIPLCPPPSQSPTLNQTFQGDIRPSSPDSMLGGSVQMSSSVMLSVNQYTRTEYLRQALNLDRLIIPTQLSTKVSTYLICILGVLLAILDGLLVALEDSLTEVGTIVAIVLVLLLCVVPTVALYRQPQNPKEISFKVPFMPLTPILSIFVNIYLMMKLSPMTWVRFGGWMAVGFLVYFFYGIRHSSEGLKRAHCLAKDESLRSPMEECPLLK